MTQDKLTTTETAKLCEVSYSRVMLAIRDKQLPAERFGHQWQITRRDALKWRDRRNRKPGPKLGTRKPRQHTSGGDLRDLAQPQTDEAAKAEG